MAKSVLDANMRRFITTVEYKQLWAGSEIEYADRYYPSSKICSNCGNMKDDLKLAQRTYKCDNCGISFDRDLNAAINLSKYNSRVGSTQIITDMEMPRWQNR